ncbi:MAG: hypothetical protein D6791_14120 [Chloroflexi bacterium]|nr:MAG: hypothetical protein D6791_14120 [Chloroflexota bacterium]
MINFRKWIVVLLVLTQLFSVSAIVALAAPEAKSQDESLTAGELKSELGLSGNVELFTLTDSEMDWLLQVCHRMAEYLELNEDGTLSLKPPDLGYVGVDQRFVSEYQLGLEGLNELVRMGWVTFDNEFNMHFTANVPQDEAEIEHGLQQIDEKLAGEELAALDSVEPARFRGGFGFGFRTGGHHIPFRFGSFHSSFGARFGHGRFSHRFGFLFGRHGSFFNRHFRFGGFGFIHRSVFSHGFGHHNFYYRPYYSRHWYRARFYY